MKHIQSGELGFSKTGDEFQTVLGSCVCVCIFDSKLKMGGLIHYLLPSRQFSSNKLSINNNPLNFGDTAIPSLLKCFKNAGSNPANLVVYLFGGGSPAQTSPASKLNVGIENLKYAKKILSQYNLSIYKEKTGGSGMLVKFNTSSGDVFVSQTKNVNLGPIEAQKVKTVLNTVKTTSNVVPISQGTIVESTLIKVLIVDDSNPVRRILRACLEKNKNIKIVGEAPDPIEAEKLRKEFLPDVMTLDVNMPKKDGVTYLGELMAKNPMPVIMISDLSLKEASPVMKALEIGAFDYIQKPSASEIEKFGEKLNEVITEASKFKRKMDKKGSGITRPGSKQKIAIVEGAYDTSIELIAIGSSTGGTEALRSIFKELPASTPPIVIVQHIPAAFSGAFADSLNKLSKIEVREAKDGDVLTKSTAYIAPGGKQMKLKERNGQLVININDEAPVNRFKPSVDYMFNSIVTMPIAKKTKVALLTGMGDDGARGMLALKNVGAFTIAQNEESCVVYGMPKVAVEMNAAQKILDLSEIGYHLLHKVA